MERLPFDNLLPEENRWDDMGTYFEGADLGAWPAYEALTSDPEAPNGWGGHIAVQQTFFPCYYREGRRE